MPEAESPPNGGDRVGKIVADSCCRSAGTCHINASLLDSLSISRYGESSGELGSVMILNPTFGNSLEKQ